VASPIYIVDPRVAAPDEGQRADEQKEQNECDLHA
jgi:hypothetical protein